MCGGGGGSSVANGVASISPSSSVFLVGSQQRGLGFRETLTLLVLLTRGTIDEKTKCKSFVLNYFDYSLCTRLL